MTGMDKPAQKRRTTKNKHPEDDLQIVICQYLDLLPGTKYHMTPNHLWLGKPTGAIMNYIEKQKRMGFKKGPSDLCISFVDKYDRGVIVWAENKIKPNGPSDEQKDFIDWMNFIGESRIGEGHGKQIYADVVYTLDELIALLRRAGHPHVR